MVAIMFITSLWAVLLFEYKQDNLIIRDGPLENLWGGGGGRNTKKIFAQGKIK